MSRKTKRASRGARVKARARTNSRVRAARHPARIAAPRNSRKVLDPAVAHVLKLYEEAIRRFNKQSFRRAQELFEKVVAGPSRELAERARVHIAICAQRLERPASVHLRTADDHYHYAVSQINLANYEEARPHLEKARKLAPKADYIYYALASVAALSGEADEALEHLARAIKLRPENRYHARNDADFRLLQDDARFLQLVNPERPAEPRRGELRA